MFLNSMKVSRYPSPGILVHFPAIYTPGSPRPYKLNSPFGWFTFEGILVFWVKFVHRRAGQILAIQMFPSLFKTLSATHWNRKTIIQSFFATEGISCWSFTTLERDGIWCKKNGCTSNNLNHQPANLTAHSAKFPRNMKQQLKLY